MNYLKRIFHNTNVFVFLLILGQVFSSTNASAASPEVGVGVTVEFENLKNSYFNDGLYKYPSSGFYSNSYYYVGGKGKVTTGKGSQSFSSVYVTVYNGNDDALSKGAGLLGCQQSAKLIMRDTVKGILKLSAPNRAYSINIYDQTGAEKYAVVYINADYNNANNLVNCSTETMPIPQPTIPAGLPDLVVTDIIFDPLVPYYIYVEYKNIGTTQGTGDFLIKISSGNQSFPGNSYYRFPVPKPGQKLRTGGFTIGLIGLSNGMTSTVSAEIDWESRVVESNETNNKLTKTISLK